MSRIEQAWEARNALAIALLPLSWLYRTVTAIRRLGYQRGWFDVQPVSLPVVVVGNLSVGGTGKTPLCGHLVKVFQDTGWRPGIVSRGYGGERREVPHLVCEGDSPAQVGDEPLMLFQQTGAPVCVCVKRALAVEHLAKQTNVNIVFADDGLQHLAMPRDAEIVVMDGRRGLGNGWLLPAGPLREPASRLHKANIIAVQATDGQLHASLTTKALQPAREDIDNNQFQLTLHEAVSLADGERRSLQSFAGQPVLAVAGIGHPERFFDALRAIGLQVTGVAKPDHHSFTHDDFSTAEFAADPTRPVFVTSKDAVKLKALGRLSANVFEVTTNVSTSESLSKSIKALEHSLRQANEAKHS